MDYVAGPLKPEIEELELDALSSIEGRLAVCVTDRGKMSPAARRVNRLSKGAIARLLADKGFEEAKPGHVWEIKFPANFAAEAILVVKIPLRPKAELAREAGAALAKVMGKGHLSVALGGQRGFEGIILGLLLRCYQFDIYKEKKDKAQNSLRVLVADVGAVNAVLLRINALSEGVFFTRDLVNEPANILTTTEFASRLEALSALGLKVEIFDKPELEKLGMELLLSVGQGSDSPTKVVVMRWEGGGSEKPFAFVGKGVVFDTGGISIKPADGMEEMTMDMGGAGVVGGLMKALALRKARANVVGVIGLVENMPSGAATRPGDIVKSMKGDTVEIINTDAEGRLVLADCLWYTQERFKPIGIINLATLTGAIIVALGHDKAGVFSNHDALVGKVLDAAEAEGEGAWRLPLAASYDAQLKSRLADMKNIGTRAGGAITAAQFLQRFIQSDQPWAHIDIAGVALQKSATILAPAGASGWGVLALNRLIEKYYETKG